MELWGEEQRYQGPYQQGVSEVEPMEGKEEKGIKGKRGKEWGEAEGDNPAERVDTMRDGKPKEGEENWSDAVEVLEKESYLGEVESLIAEPQEDWEYDEKENQWTGEIVSMRVLEAKAEGLHDPHGNLSSGEKERRDKREREGESFETKERRNL